MICMGALPGQRSQLLRVFPFRVPTVRLSPYGKSTEKLNEALGPPRVKIAVKMVGKLRRPQTESLLFFPFNPLVNLRICASLSSVPKSLSFTLRDCKVWFRIKSAAMQTAPWIPSEFLRMDVSTTPRSRCFKVELLIKSSRTNRPRPTLLPMRFALRWQMPCP